MWTTILSFIKGKLFSNSGIFLSIFGILFILFLYSNSNVVLSKFGFETTTTLKSQLTKAQADLVTLKSVNDDLNNTIKQLNDNHARDIKAMNELQVNKEISKEVITFVTRKKKDVENKVEKSLNDNSIYTLTTVTLPLKEVNELSSNNINSLNETYTKLFEKDLKMSETVSDVSPDIFKQDLQQTEILSC